MSDPDKLLNLVLEGYELSDDEWNDIAEILYGALEGRSDASFLADEAYTSILCIKHAGKVELSSILEKFLDYRDPLTAELALETLCLAFTKTKNYLERVFQFAVGVSWDEFFDLRVSAIKILGEYCHESIIKNEAPSIDCLEFLLNTFEDEAQDLKVRKFAYYALLRVLDYSWEEIPSDYAEIDFSKGSKSIDWDGIRSLKSKYQNNKRHISLEDQRFP